MESQKSKTDKDVIVAALAAFRRLGSNAGMKKGRIWILLDCASKKVQRSCSEYITLPELLGIDIAKWNQSLGKRWKNYLSKGGYLSEGFYITPWKNGQFITVLDSKNDPTGFDAA